MTDHYIILAGQSNALGFGNTGPAPYVPTAQVQIFADSNGDGLGDVWNYMNPGVNTGMPANPTVWGPEVEIANRWRADHPDPNDHLWIVKVAKGSTGLAEDASQLDWSPASVGEMYDRATAVVGAAKAQLVGSPYAFDHFDAMMWMQGETDATDPAKAAAYNSNLTGFLAEARFDWGVTEVVAGRITTGAGAPADNLAVRVAQWDVDAADAHLATFKTIGDDMQADGIHYAAAGHISLGDAFYDGWF